MTNLPLTPHQAAPDFTLSSKSSKGLQRITLSTEYSKNNIVLLFFPMAFTGVCTEEMCSVTSELNAYADLKATVYGISGDNPFAQEAWAIKENITVTLLSDYEHQVAKAYGIDYESFLPEAGLGMGGVPKRSAFIIDKEGIIQYSESHADPKQLPNFDKIKDCLATLI